MFVFSLKDQLEPEFELVTRSGVLRVRFCEVENLSHMLAFSCYDGVVGICDLGTTLRMRNLHAQKS